MKILWLMHFVPYPPAGGSLQRSYHLLRHVARQHEVHLLALQQPRLLGSGRPLDEAIVALSRFCASVRVFPQPAERSSMQRLMTIARSVCGPSPFDVLWLRSVAMGDAVAEWRDRSDVDLVLVETEGLFQYIEHWPHPRIVVSHHNIESELAERRAVFEGSWWKRALLRRDAAKLRVLERKAATRAAMNIVVSELDGERLSAIVPGAAIEAVDNGVDTDYWVPSEEQRGMNTLVFAGTLGWYPNRDAVEFLLGKIWPALSMNVERRLSLVGRDPPTSARAAAAKDSRIAVTGFVPDVRPYLHSASIYVCPIRVGGGTRLKVLDGLAMARPLVATAIAVEGLEMVDGKHYLRAETASEFIAQIHRLETDAELRQHIGAAGRRLVVDRYDWHAIGGKLDAALERSAHQALTNRRVVG